MKRFFSLAALLLLTTGAFAQSRTDKVEYQESSARNLEPEHLMLLTPLVADLQVASTKVQHVEREAFAKIPVTLDNLKSVSEFKKIALSRAARKHNADVLVGTTIDVATNADGFLEITVTGYPAVYRNFRIAQKSDLDVIEYGRKVERENKNSALIGLPQSHSEVKGKEIVKTN